MNPTPEDTSNEHAAGAGNTFGYVKKKIKSNEKASPLARARKEHWPASLAKVIKKAISISHLITGEDQADSLQVLRDAKHATHRIFDPVTRQLIEVPDHKTRLAAITLELAYTEGRPVERQIVATAQFDDLKALRDRMRSLPSLQKIVEKGGKEVAPALPDAETGVAPKA